MSKTIQNNNSNLKFPKIKPSKKIEDNYKEVISKREEERSKNIIMKLNQQKEEEEIKQLILKAQKNDMKELKNERKKASNIQNQIKDENNLLNIFNKEFNLENNIHLNQEEEEEEEEFEYNLSSFCEKKSIIKSNEKNEKIKKKLNSRSVSPKENSKIPINSSSLLFDKDISFTYSAADEFDCQNQKNYDSKKYILSVNDSKKSLTKPPIRKPIVKKKLSEIRETRESLYESKSKIKFKQENENLDNSE